MEKITNKIIEAIKAADNTTDIDNTICHTCQRKASRTIITKKTVYYLCDECARLHGIATKELLQKD